MRAALLIVLLGIAAPAHAAWMLPPSPFKAKDFCVVKRDGWYHCFYIRKDTSVPYDSTERNLGHAISRDLYLWTQLPTVLPVRLDQWDNAKVWAPDIREVDGVYYMFYTGVSEQPGVYAFHQRIGLATSTDLMTWNRLEEPVLSCAQVRWTFCDPLQYAGGEFRDSYLMPNPQGGGWLMLYTARPASAPATYVVGTASSAGDLTQWVNGEPLWISHSSVTGSPQVESPHMFYHGGLYYLGFTGNGTQPLRLATGPDPLGDVATWTYRGTMGAMLGLNTAEWFASESFRDGTHEYYCFVNYDRLDFREIVWGSDWRFTLVQPALFHVQSLTWSAPEVGAGQPVQLTITAVNTFASQVNLEAFAVAPDGSRTPVPLADLGLPASIPMTNLITVYTWYARTWPQSDSSVEIVVRMTDQTAEAPPLRIVADDWLELPWSGRRDGNRRVPREFVEFARARPRVGFRALAGSPLGRTALLVELDKAAPARIELFDLAGRRVRQLADRTYPVGATVIPWDGREQGGAPAHPGVYFARLTTSGLVRSVRMLLSP